jgi:hypothetical protein
MMKLQEIGSRKLKITTISWGSEDPEKCMLFAICYFLRVILKSLFLVGPLHWKFLIKGLDENCN